MKSRTFTPFILMTLFAALAIPVQLAAQGQNQQPPRYTVIDLGTLGGPFFSQAFGISNKGSVVGFAELLGDTDFPSGFPPVHAFLWRKGLMTDLGSFGGRVSQAIAVNERGEVAGFSQTSATDPSGEDFCGSGDFRRAWVVSVEVAGFQDK
jgi:probable HAF family extracellular repeat protein